MKTTGPSCHLQCSDEIPFREYLLFNVIWAAMYVSRYLGLDALEITVVACTGMLQPISLELVMSQAFASRNDWNPTQVDTA